MKYISWIDILQFAWLLGLNITGIIGAWILGRHSRILNYNKKK